MALLAGTCYDPTGGAAVTTAATTSLLAMTALDTTNLRLTFTAPSNGTVLVRLGGVIHGATTSPQVLLGVLDGATVKGRQAPRMGKLGGVATTQQYAEASFLVTGLTPGNSYTWDAAYGVEFVVASTAIKWGGPNDTTTNNAFGGFIFEVWETRNLLAGTMYDPSSAGSIATSSLAAMTALDTTNLRLTFTGPSSGRVIVRMRGVVHGSSSTPSLLFGVLDGATVKARVASGCGATDVGAIQTTTHQIHEAVFPVSVTPSTSYTWDAARGVELQVASTTLAWGGPDNTTQDDAFGGFSYEVWAA